MMFLNDYMYTVVIQSEKDLQNTHICIKSVHVCIHLYYRDLCTCGFVLQNRRVTYFIVSGKKQVTTGPLGPLRHAYTEK